MSLYHDRKAPEQPISEETTAQFAKLPIFETTLKDPAWRSVSMSRTVTDSGRGHTLMGRTWNTPDTIPALVSFYQPANSTLSKSASTSEELPQSQLKALTEVRRFYAFGDGMTAHPGLLHGGIVSCILDSGLGAAVAVNVGGNATEGKGEGWGTMMMTVQLNTSFRAPVRTPGVVVVRGWIEKKEGDGRKMWAKGVVEGPGGVVHAEADGLWVRAKSAKV